MIHDVVVVEIRNAVVLMCVNAADEVEKPREAADFARLAVDAFVGKIDDVEIFLAQS